MDHGSSRVRNLKIGVVGLQGRIAFCTDEQVPMHTTPIGLQCERTRCALHTAHGFCFWKRTNTDLFFTTRDGAQIRSQSLSTVAPQSCMGTRTNFKVTFPGSGVGFGFTLVTTVPL